MREKVERWLAIALLIFTLVMGYLDNCTGVFHP